MPSVATGLRKVLLVDDNPVFLQALRHLLAGRREFFVCGVAHDAAGAVEVTRQQLPDTVFLDIGLPDRCGLDVIPDLREAHPGLRIVVMTALATPSLRAVALSAGADHFVVKDDLSPERLLEVLNGRCESAGANAREAEPDAFEAGLHSLIECIPDGVVVHRQGRILLINRRLVELLGYTDAADLVGRPVFDTVQPEDRALVAQRMQQVAADGRPLRPQELRLQARDGTPRFAEGTAVRIVFRGEDAVLAVLRDTTERREQAQRLMLTDRLATVGTLAAGIAHEINTPLSFVLGNVEFLAGRLPSLLRPDAEGSDDIVEAIRDAFTGARQVHEIVKDIKTFCRSEDAGRRSADLRGVLEAAARMATAEIRHRARLVTRFSEVPLVLGNESRLGQVFLNLLINSAQAIPPGRVRENEIRLSVQADGAGQVIAEVRDTGCGMPPETLARMFDPFFTTKAGTGTGLGLPICRTIVEEAGGRIEVESEPGSGSVFRVVLRVAPPAPVAAITARAPRVAKRGAVVLVVHDEPRVASVIRRQLGPPHKVVSALGALEALGRLDAGERFDAIFSDVMMPAMTGMELYAEIARRDAALAERVVFINGGVTTAEVRTFLEATPNFKLQKPFDTGAVTLALRGVVDLPPDGADDLPPKGGS